VKPSRKVTAAAVGGAAATVLILGAQWLFSAPDAPAGLEGALATLFAFGAGYLTREDDGEF
jgi:predicted anti-sigma-YlaC factor YlaD